ncbi:hypothetical protein FRC17_004124 [Serendipita sp. 399]|nr:hypothetical protein FRC17_004124 [Serendipita sp. 399]
MDEQLRHDVEAAKVTHSVDLASTPLSQQSHNGEKVDSSRASREDNTVEEVPVMSTESRYGRGQGTKEDPYIVEWDTDDDEDPYNWPKSRKWLLTYQLAFGAFCATFGSSSYSGAVNRARKELHMTTAVAILPISIYVLGFALGPLIFAPLSEVYGRIPCALAPNPTVLILFRFLAGTFGSSPLANAGGAIADIWNASERGVATTLYSSGPWFGPIIGPLVGGFLIETPPGWRMVFWIVFIVAAIPTVLGIFFMPETYAPVLLRRRAQKLQAESGDTIYYVSHYDVGHQETVIEKLSTNLRRPFEPIVTLLSIWVGLVYGALYATFIAFPIVFQRTRQWSPGFAGLAFLGIGVGVVIGNISAPWMNRWYQRIAARQPNGKASPEARLLPGMIGGVLVPIGLFWFAWTNTPNFHYIIPIMSGIPFGLGTLLIFGSVVAYLMDTYQTLTASAIAASVVLRSVLGALFPLFTSGLFKQVGTRWGASVFAFLALLCTPLPFLFYYFGPNIRLNSRVARQYAIAQIQEQRQAERKADKKASQNRRAEKESVSRV